MIKTLIVVAVLGVSFMASKCEVNNTGGISPPSIMQMR